MGIPKRFRVGRSEAECDATSRPREAIFSGVFAPAAGGYSKRLSIFY